MESLRESQVWLRWSLQVCQRWTWDREELLVPETCILGKAGYSALSSNTRILLTGPVS